jgi:hypothetical protein
VALGVLVEGIEASRYLTGDNRFGDQLAELAERLAGGSPEVSLPLAATLLREALKEHLDGLGRDRLVTQSIESENLKES